MASGRSKIVMGDREMTCLLFGAHQGLTDCVVAMTHEIIKRRERDLQASGEVKT